MTNPDPASRAPHPSAPSEKEVALDRWWVTQYGHPPTSDAEQHLFWVLVHSLRIAAWLESNPQHTALIIGAVLPKAVTAAVHQLCLRMSEGIGVTFAHGSLNEMAASMVAGLVAVRQFFPIFPPLSLHADNPDAGPGSEEPTP